MECDFFTERAGSRQEESYVRSVMCDVRNGGRVSLNQAAELLTCHCDAVAAIWDGRPQVNYCIKYFNNRAGARARAGPARS